MEGRVLSEMVPTIATGSRKSRAPEVTHKQILSIHSYKLNLSDGIDGCEDSCATKPTPRPIKMRRMGSITSRGTWALMATLFVKTRRYVFRPCSRNALHGDHALNHFDRGWDTSRQSQQSFLQTGSCGTCSKAYDRHSWARRSSDLKGF